MLRLSTRARRQSDLSNPTTDLDLRRPAGLRGAAASLIVPEIALPYDGAYTHERGR